jgi:uncharacterized phage infection (PIP) family protein YhgE
MSTLDDYVTKARAALDQLRPQLDELKVQADLAKAEARDRLQSGIASLQQAQARAKSQVDEAAKAGQGTWRTTAEKAEKSVNDLGTQLQSLVDQVQDNVGAAAPAAKKAWSTFLDEWNRAKRDRERLLSED